MMEETSSFVKYGRGVMLGLSWLLAILVFLPNGSYRLGSTKVLVNALSAPFVDYGGGELAIGAILILVVAILWFTKRRPRQTAWGLVFTSAGILGSILPDVWSPNTMSILDGTRYRTFDVRLAYGFWVNIALVVLLLIVSSVVLWKEPRSRVVSAH